MAAGLVITGKNRKPRKTVVFCFILYPRELFQKLGLDAQPDIDYLAALFPGEFLAACCRCPSAADAPRCPVFFLFLCSGDARRAARFRLPAAYPSACRVGQASFGPSASNFRSHP